MGEPARLEGEAASAAQFRYFPYVMAIWVTYPVREDLGRA